MSLFPGEKMSAGTFSVRKHNKQNENPHAAGPEDFDMNREEMLNFLKNEARGISVMFGPNCETIVHDMTRPAIRFWRFSTAR